MARKKPKLPFWKRSPELERVATHLGKKFDQFTMEDVRSALELIGITAPFVLADRKIGGNGLGGVATGLLADYFIRHKTMLPKVTILGNSYEINAGYAMLAGIAGFLGINAIAQYGLIPFISNLDLPTDANAAAVQDELRKSEEAFNEYQDAIAKNEPQGVIEWKRELYQQSKVWRK